jgi:hypothetical protein
MTANDGGQTVPGERAAEVEKMAGGGFRVTWRQHVGGGTVGGMKHFVSGSEAEDWAADFRGGDAPTEGADASGL